MDAKELTKVYEDYSSRTKELEKKVDFMEQEVGKLRMLYNDMEMTVKSLDQTIQNQRRLIGDLRCEIMELERSNK